MFEQQLKYDLFQAYYDARRNKRNTWNQLRFEINYESELFLLAEEISERRYDLRPSIAFVINEPVKREILAADFRDRVVHHLIFNYTNPELDAQFITDSYSCRVGKGTHYGIERAAGFVRQCSENYTKDCYVLKLDIRGYFMSMNKHLLWQKLQSMRSYSLNEEINEQSRTTEAYTQGKEETIWYLLDKVIWNDPRKNCIVKGKLSDWDDLPPSKSLFHSAADCGLPIGNLTSQLFSNVYLHDFDCFVKNDLGVEYYGRYVDDFVLIHRDKAFLLDALNKIKQHLAEHSGLILHPNKIYLQHYSKGFAFLGAYIKPRRCYIGNRTKKKFRQAVAESNRILTANKPHREDLEKVRATLNSYLGIMQHFKTYNIRRKTLLDKSHEFFKYGYLEKGLTKYKLKVES
ncbi:MAG: RNA-directed DNA polymerase [Dysgonamonadaceae bacterium]|jgi:hypothetical protein|nr:RNA-directed DNA polymerase [Dysgonamonadaceae bacterium]